MLNLEPLYAVPGIPWNSVDLSVYLSKNADLLELVERWPDLPVDVRRQIVTLILSHLRNVDR